MTMDTSSRDEAVRSPDSGSRRSLLNSLSTVGVVVALTAAYGTFAAMLGRFLFPARPPRKGWMYVAVENRLRPGDALLFETPRGATVNIARQEDGASAESFIALSSTCPHLGCQVHWESQNDRFFCPCHNGVFSPDGTGIGGPPGDAGQSLPRYPLKVEDGLLYIEVDREDVAMGPGRIIEPYAGPLGPGHDPCLKPVSREPATDCGCAVGS